MDRADTRTARGTQVFYRSNLVPIAFDARAAASFLVVAPSWIDPARALHASQQRAFFRPETPLPAAPALSWRPSYPDRADGPLGLAVTQQRAVFAPERVLPPVGPLSWSPQYPTFLGRLRVGQTEIVTPLAITPSLSWLGQYPDLLRRQARAGLLECVEPLRLADITLVVPTLAWSPIYPEFARSGKTWAQLYPWTGQLVVPAEALNRPAPIVIIVAADDQVILVDGEDTTIEIVNDDGLIIIPEDR